MLLNCGVGEDSWESLRLQGVHPKGDQSWVFIGRTDVETETPVLWPPHVKCWLIGKDPDAGGRGELGAGGEGDNRGWDGWMASPIQWAWIWVNSGSWWWIGWPGMLRFMGSQRVRHDWVTELKWTELNRAVLPSTWLLSKYESLSGCFLLSSYLCILYFQFWPRYYLDKYGLIGSDIFNITVGSF